MKHFYPLLFLIFLSPVSVFAQVDSTAVRQDTIPKDTVRPKPKPRITRDTTRRFDPPISRVLQIDSTGIKDSLRIRDSLRTIQLVADSVQKKITERRSPAILKEGEKKIFVGKEWLFYWLVFLLILFGLLRRAFAKYFYDLFRVFFKTTLK